MDSPGERKSNTSFLYQDCFVVYLHHVELPTGEGRVKQNFGSHTAGNRCIVRVKIPITAVWPTACSLLGDCFKT